MDNFPSACVIASYDSVCHNNNVLYRLVRPLPDGSGVQSTDRLVNVVPYRRKYTFEKKAELVEFGQQILRRPLVLQSVLHFGRGLGNYCSTCYQDELWLVMVNQTHPKILSRLQMALDSAKLALERGQPFEIKFRFGKTIQRAYKEHLAQKEKEEAQASSKTLLKYLTYFRYAEWEYCDLNLRYHGHGAAHNKASAPQSLQKLEMKWDFEDIGMHEMMWNQLNNEVYPHPHMSQVSEDEIRQLLPGWTVNGVSPLENIGDSIPECNYNYAQAGRLYASFRKKRRPQDRPRQEASRSVSSSDQPDEEDDYDEEVVGAVGYDSSLRAVGYDSSDQPAHVDQHYIATEHDFQYPDENKPKPPSRSRQRYHNTGISYDEKQSHQDIHQPVSEKNIHQHTHLETHISGSNQRPSSAVGAHTQSSNGKKEPNSPVAVDRYGHIYSNVEIRLPKAQQHHIETRASNHTNQYEELDVRAYVHDRPRSSHHLHTGSLQKQDSDRSSRSTIADSGYCPEGDSDPSRGGSYDYNEQGNVTRLNQDQWGYANFPAGSVADDGGLVNPAFRVNSYDSDHSVQNSKQHVSKMIKDQHIESKRNRQTAHVSDYTVEYSNTKDYVGDVVKAPPRQKRIASTNSSTPKIAESFI